LAGIIALAYAVYLYLQIMHPALFLRAPAVQTQPVAAATPVPAPAADSESAPPQQGSVSASSPAPASSPLIPAQSVFSSKPDTPAAPASAPALPAAGTVTPKPAPATPAPAAALAAVAVPVQQNKIAVSRGDSTAPRINSAVSDAYAALESGRFDTARQLYEQALRGEPNNIDALLGAAAIARQENRTDDATKHYLKILETDPRHALAQTGLIALLGRADPQAAESRLKQLAAREPSPALYFTLGNLYADQGQWSQAQQAYFQAHHLEAGNPDYAYNLAVALEHLSQPKLALGFYRRAVQLAAGRGRANFNPAQAQARITQLAARLE
jgi:tetratricopeptide (TPR) repeat protein